MDGRCISILLSLNYDRFSNPNAVIWANIKAK